MNALLEVKNLSRNFGGIAALQKVSLQFEAQRISAVIGPNGAGKSTLFNLITGLDSADEGEVYFAGRSLLGLPAHRINRLGVARTFQNIRLFKQMSVAENILVGCHANNKKSNRFLNGLSSLLRRSKEELIFWEKTLYWLEFFRLVALRNELANSLPYGRQRQLEMARALVNEPQLLFLDEPAAGMNPQETAELMSDIRRILDLGVTVVLIEHDMKFVMNLVEKIYVLNFGQKIAEGTPEEVRRHPEVIRAYLGDEAC